ncbi:hypothetical protein EBS02_03805 [bacterium]|nr:hypothetical protein [bacterium]
MKINPNYKEILADFFTVEEPDDILKKCFALEYEDWDNAFELISQFGCSEEYEAQFQRYYSSWSKGLNYYEPSEWIRELEQELKHNKKDEHIIKDIDDEIVSRFEDNWCNDYIKFADEVIGPLVEASRNINLCRLFDNGIRLNVEFIADYFDLQ